jgi:hypothetical protein
MYFLNVRRLQDMLAGTSLSPSESLRYLIGFLVIGPAPGLVLYLPPKSPGLTASHFAAVWLTAVIGAAYCYRRNQAPQAFLERFVSVGFVMAVRFAVAFVLIVCAGIIAAAIFLGITGVNIADRLSSQSHAVAWLSVLVGVVWHLTYFWRVGVRLGQIPASQ